ncbi:nck-associated protein 5-like isoform X1 [Gouania willdenowi]|uniref:nck-associated protein 5-like isoform X1 n=1 Tax=Gouania willdenowi TaxID=441366 RepID=UPI00105671F8|nr:nck-associated protein 5-like isoform X1 [Gouania willdenowi]
MMSWLMDNGRNQNELLVLLLAECMEANKCISEILKQLEDERRSQHREKLAVVRLQREAARSKSQETMRQKLILDLNEELRVQSEKRVCEVSEEWDRGRTHMVSLQQHFSRMEETVRSLLQNPSAVDTVDIMKVYKEKLCVGVQQQQDESPLKVCGSKPAEEEDDFSLCEENQSKLLLERLKTLEEQNSALTQENQSQREQYERCLDQVANQVVQALLTQKDLRQECVKLRTRVSDLEQQNRVLSVLFQQKIRPTSELLLQKLHSKILNLSAADLLELEKSQTFLLQRNDSSNEIHLAPPPGYHSSSSELSLSSSEFSSSSWNDGRSGKMVSLTWEKRRSLGSSTPGNICASPDESPTRRKESHILEGLRKLQRKNRRTSSRVSRSTDKDCMNSNEGIYSLDVRKSGRGLSEPAQIRRGRLIYDSDDADDELAHSSCRDNIPTKDGSSGSMSSWMGNIPAVPPPGYDSKERPEKLLSFINSFLPEGGRPSAFSKPTKLRLQEPIHGVIPHKVPESSECHTSFRQAERDAPRPFPQSCLRTQSADSRPHPFSLTKDPGGAAKCTQSEESQSGEPLGLHYSELVPQKSLNPRNYSILESPEKPSEYQIRTGREGAQQVPPPQRKLIKPTNSRAHKGVFISRVPSSSPLRSSKVRGVSLSGPPPPTAKTSQFIKSAASCIQSPKAVSVKRDGGKPPSRKDHCEENKNHFRSPSPPLPPGRSTSLLVRPLYNDKTTTVRGPPPSYNTSMLPNLQSTLPIKDRDGLDPDYGTPQKTCPKMTFTPIKGTSKRAVSKDDSPSLNSGPETAHKGLKNAPPPYSALRGSLLHQSNTAAPNLPEKTSKTRIPMGFKAFLKSPPSHKNAPPVPAKQEKDHINAVSKETAQCDGEPDKEPLPEGNVPHFLCNKPHLKPALGMNGAKARSQSFSTSSVASPDGLTRIRTHIITNSGDRGNSLTRQTSLDTPSTGQAESPVCSPRMRMSHYGGMTASHVNKERRIPISDRIAPRHFQAVPSSCLPSENPVEETKALRHSFKEPEFSKDVQTPETEEKKTTIEEKVMMGIEENLQKCQEQEKVTSIESKQKTGPSLANWFGLRKSKLPGLSGKKADAPKIKAEKKKEKKLKDEQDEANLTEMNNKLSSIMDQIQCSSAFLAKDQLVRELLGRTATKGNSLTSPTGNSAHKHAEVEMCEDMLILSQKMELQAENNMGNISDSARQDHNIGSTLQTRTLDSGIGTFPLPDPISRHAAKSEPRPPSPEATPHSTGHAHSETLSDVITRVYVPIGSSSVMPEERACMSLENETKSEGTGRDESSSSAPTSVEKSLSIMDLMLPSQEKDVRRLMTYSRPRTELKKPSVDLSERGRTPSSP